MAAVEMRVDLSNLVDALVSGNTEQVIAAARDHLGQDEAADVLIGRIALIAAHGDREGHVVTTLGAAAMLSRYLHFLPQPLEPDSPENPQQKELARALPLFVQALLMAAPAVQAGHNAPENYPDPYYPSELLDSGKTVKEIMQDAVVKGNTLQVERIILGLYGTGADYRTMQVRTYDGTSSVFQHDGHALTCAVRGFQNLDAVEWGDRAPHIIHWLAPHLALSEGSQEPTWAATVRNFVSEHADGLGRLRKRLSSSKDEGAQSLPQLLLSEADTTQVCQGVYDALLTGGASPQTAASTIALAAAQILRKLPIEDHETFVQAANGLLYSAAARMAIHQVHQADDVLPLVFFSAAYVNTLYKELAAQKGGTRPAAATPAVARGAGLIGISQLETLRSQIKDQNVTGALATAQRYLQLGFDARALFGSLGLAAAQIDARADQGRTLQIVQAASEEFLAWPRGLARTNADAFLEVALRSSAFGKRDPLIERL